MKNKKGYKILIVDMDTGNTMMDYLVDTINYSINNDIETVYKPGKMEPAGLVRRSTDITIQASEDNKEYTKEYAEAIR
jgi:hypothetical protein